MSFINPPKPEDLFRNESDGYETGGLIYFRFEGREMVALVRERSVFERHQSETLAAYTNSKVSSEVYGAALLLQSMIPRKP